MKNLYRNLFALSLCAAFASAHAETFQFHLPLKGITVTPPVCALPWGGTILNGQTVTAFQSTSVPYTSTCSSEVRTCTNGVLSGSFTAQSCTVEPAPTPTGYLAITVSFANLSGGGYAGSNGVTWQNNGYQASCADGIVLSDSVALPYDQSSSQNEYNTWGGSSVKVCLPAFSSDAKAISTADTDAYLVGGWFVFGGKAAGISAGGKKWILSTYHSRDTAGAYPGFLNRRIHVTGVASYPATESEPVRRKDGSNFLYTFNVAPN